MTIERAEVLVVIPAFNESATVGRVVSDVQDAGYDVLVVDDGSVDDTATIAREAGAAVLSLPFNLGVGGALRLGFKYAVQKDKRAVVQVDADGQHDPNDIDRLVRAADETGAHLVIGSRFLRLNTTMQISLLRRLAMRILARSASRATGVILTDTTSGFRLIREPLLRQFSEVFPVNYLGDTFEAVVSAGRAGYAVAEIDTEMHERSHGRSSASPWRAAQFTMKAMVVALLHLQPRLDHGPDY